ncbi:MAG: winged helix-turn-helix domain-containing protein [Candidatus Bathyarchaeia archaeon]
MFWLKFSFALQIPRTFKYRDRMTIIGEILKNISKSNKGLKKTQIMQSANLNYVQTKKYLNYLNGMGLIVYTERKTYLLTEKGTKFLLLMEMQMMHSIR